MIMPFFSSLLGLYGFCTGTDFVGYRFSIFVSPFGPRHWKSASNTYPNSEIQNLQYLEVTSRLANISQNVFFKQNVFCVLEMQKNPLHSLADVWRTHATYNRHESQQFAWRAVVHSLGALRSNYNIANPEWPGPNSGFSEIRAMQNFPSLLSEISNPLTLFEAPEAFTRSWVSLCQEH